MGGARAFGRPPAGRPSCLAVDETVILLHPPVPLAGVSTVMDRERQQNDSLVVNGYSGKMTVSSVATVAKWQSRQWLQLQNDSLVVNGYSGKMAVSSVATVAKWHSRQWLQLQNDSLVSGYSCKMTVSSVATVAPSELVGRPHQVAVGLLAELRDPPWEGAHKSEVIRAI